MRPTDFPERNVLIAESQEQYGTLPSFRFEDDPDGTVVTCWKMSWRERIKALFTGRVWLFTLTFNRPLQPLAMTVDSPFTPETKNANQPPQ